MSNSEYRSKFMDIPPRIVEYPEVQTTIVTQKITQKSASPFLFI